MSGTLLIVYNADEGLLAALFDAVHKAVSPATYPCSLCAVTYGAVSMRPEWRAYLRTLPFGVRFHHRPDFRRAYPALAELPLPAILLDRVGAPDLLVGAADLAKVQEVAQLQALLDDALAAVG